ncbi:hypothetical protein MNKW57_12930 [Biformimicrobium ophioploci]|uniref:Tc1-like transposase DDE domain-containing protein n=1 Tax=Biformimicrobium ophioploci TaxID=3036711 RepID=A0ABQ6LXZ6_9GAMM|nr:hypothetical protein MNKW57_12930 [Microbulbifer sp. NKW57]
MVVIDRLSHHDRPTPVEPYTASHIPFSDRVAFHFSPTATGKRLSYLIDHFSRLKGEPVDAEFIVKFCIDQIFTDVTNRNYKASLPRIFKFP